MFKLLTTTVSSFTFLKICNLLKSELTVCPALVRAANASSIVIYSVPFSVLAGDDTIFTTG